MYIAANLKSQMMKKYFSFANRSHSYDLGKEKNLGEKKYTEEKMFGICNYR